MPGSETRNIIQDSIKDAVRLLRDTVDIEADRDTKENLVHLILHRLFSRKSTIAIFLLLMLVLYVDMRQLIKMETRK